MPSAKVCIWNIQNYGAGGAAVAANTASRRRYGTANVVRNKFITSFVRAQQIDVLLIIEASKNGWTSLQNLQAQLNHGLGAEADWAISLCGSALAKDNGPNPPAAPADLTFRTDGRSEGYAVAWRTNQPARFGMLIGLHQIAQNTLGPAGPGAFNSPLNLTTKGRPAGEIEQEVMVGAGRKRKKVLVQGYDVLGGFDPAAPQPWPYDENGEQIAWPDLELPTTSTYNPNQLRLAKARRPAYVVLALNAAGGAQQQLCPVAAYHAPSNAARARWGAFQSGLARELYVTNGLLAPGIPNPAQLVYTDNTVLGADFNYAENNWPGEYGNFTRAFDHRAIGGARCRAAPPGTAPDPERASTVQLLDAQGQPRNGPNTSEYLALRIDTAFFRSGLASKGERVNVLQALINDANGASYGEALLTLNAHLQGVAAALAGPNQRMDPAMGGGVGPQQRSGKKWRPLLCGSYGASFLNWDDFINEIEPVPGPGARPRFATARHTAEFFHIFVSDHLPLVVTLAF